MARLLQFRIDRQAVTHPHGASTYFGRNHLWQLVDYTHRLIVQQFVHATLDSDIGNFAVFFNDKRDPHFSLDTHLLRHLREFKILSNKLTNLDIETVKPLILRGEIFTTRENGFVLYVDKIEDLI